MSETEEKTQGGPVQTPLHELLEGIPKGHVIELEMKDEEGRVYGHQSIPVGLYAHEAANQLQQARMFKMQVQSLSDSLVHLLGRAP